MSNALKSTLLHTLELAIVLLLAVGVSYFFPEHRLEALGIVGIALGGFTKYLRASDVPIPDYVNGEQS